MAMNFRWDKKKLEMAADIAEGMRRRQVADKHGVSQGYVDKLRKRPEFAARVDELTMSFGISQKAERMRIVQQVIDDKMRDGLETKKDLLDWVKLAGEIAGDTGNTNINITTNITQAMQDVPAAERPAAYLSLARGLVLGLNTVPGIVRVDPDVIDGSYEEGELDLINAPVGGEADDSSGSGD